MDKEITDFNVRLRTIRIRDLIVGIILTFIISIILAIIFPELYETEDLFFIIFLFIGTLLFIYALKGTKGINTNFKNLFESNIKKEIIYVLILNLLFTLLFTFLFSLADIIIGFNDPTWISIWDSETFYTDPNFLIFDSIGSIIFAPLLEELIFRGILFNRIKIRTGIIPAMIISSILFAVGHDFGGITSAFIFGICMCILYLKTDNILIPMSVHFLNNVIVTVILITGIDIVLAQMPWLILSIIITLIGSIVLIKYIFKETKILKTENY